MTLGLVGSSVAIGALILLVGGWGAWFSSSSSRRGPAWALDQLQRFRSLPWVIAAAGLVAVVAAEPLWLGVAMLYVAGVTGWLTRTVRLRLESFRRTYGEFDPPAA